MEGTMLCRLCFVFYIASWCKIQIELQAYNTLFAINNDIGHKFVRISVKRSEIRGRAVSIL